MVASLFTTSASQTSFASVISASSALRPEAVGDFVGAAVVVVGVGVGVVVGAAVVVVGAGVGLVVGAAVVVVGAGVGLVVGAGSGLGLGAPSGTHAAVEIPNSRLLQQFSVPHGQTRSGFQ